MVTILNFLKTFAVFLVIDIIYLGFIRRDYMTSYFARFGGYNKHIMLYGLVAWGLLAFGTQYFAVENSSTKSESFIKGALLGLVIYGVYDFTNMATIKGWSHEFVIQDILWGVGLCGTIAYLRK